MPKGPKYKKGFTLRHYFDEWWDRRTQGWKVGLIVLFGFMALVGAAVALFWAHRWAERGELIAQAKKLHEKKIQEVDNRMAADPSIPSQPLMPPSASLGVRPGE